MDLVNGTRGEFDKTKIDEMILRETKAVINLGFVPDWTPEEYRDVLDKFRISLRDLPMWAVGRAFAEWTRTRPRRPSPAEIRTLAQQELRPLTDEIERRKRTTAEAEATRRPPVSKERAEAIMAEAGFDPERTALVRKFPQAATIEEAEEKRDAPQQHRHWSETATPEQLEVLRQSRAENAKVQAARAVAEKQAGSDQ